MSYKFSDGEILYIKFICKGKTTHEIAEIFNKNFGTNLTRQQIRSVMRNYRITSDIDRKLLSEYSMKRLFNDEQHRFILDNCKGRTTPELIKLFNEHFKTEFTQKQLKGYMSRYKITNGVDCRIKKGNIPFNKGMKGMTMHPNCVATQFKKGQKPSNYMPVGSESVTTDGYVVVKIAEPNKWKFKHHIVWEQHNGAIPEGNVIIFGDRNKFNFDINNLILVSKKQLLVLNQNRLIQNDTELTKTSLAVANLIIKIKDSENKLQSV